MFWSFWQIGDGFRAKRIETSELRTPNLIRGGMILCATLYLVQSKLVQASQGGRSRGFLLILFPCDVAGSSIEKYDHKLDIFNKIVGQSIA